MGGGGGGGGGGGARAEVSPVVNWVFHCAHSTIVVLIKDIICIHPSMSPSIWGTKLYMVRVICGDVGTLG